MPPSSPVRRPSVLSQMARQVSSLTKLDSLPVPDDAMLKKHHVKGSGGKTVRFQNTGLSIGPWHNVSMNQVLYGAFCAYVRGKLTFPDTSNARIPAVQPAFPPLPLPTSAATGNSQGGQDAGPLRATWLGHACYLVELPSGVSVLFDPVFEDRCAPTQWVGPKRFTAPACRPVDIPNVDAVVISHSHFDHLSTQSIRDIVAVHPHAHFFVPLGLASFIRDLGIGQVTEMDWWEDAVLELVCKEGQPVFGPRVSQNASATFSCLPSQHASGRGYLDKDKTLWASWAVTSGGKSVWFGGDTGYRAVPELPDDIDDYGPEYKGLPRCQHFADIGRLRGPFNLGLIPIGAYKPRYLYSGWHANPYDAVCIFQDIRCEKAMAIHWGTWTLTAEDVEEPPRMLATALEKAGIPTAGVFDVCAIGESRMF